MQALCWLSPAQQSSVFDAFPGDCLALLAALPPRLAPRALSARFRAPGSLDLSRAGSLRGDGAAAAKLAGILMQPTGPGDTPLTVLNVANVGLRHDGARGFARALSSNAASLRVRAFLCWLATNSSPRCRPTRRRCGCVPPRFRSPLVERWWLAESPPL